MRPAILACLLLLAAPGVGRAQAPAPVDGVYDGGADIQGAATGRAASGRCDQRIAFKLHIRNRTFTWKLSTSQTSVTVSPDGSFSAQNGGRFLSGRIQGTHFAANTTGRGCGYIWSLDRQ
jgi:hypothetical protein